jgi:hypothetical protein
MVGDQRSAEPGSRWSLLFSVERSLGLLRPLEPDPAVGAVAERLGGRTTAATELDDRPLGDDRVALGSTRTTFAMSSPWIRYGPFLLTLIVIGAMESGVQCSKE